jgi:hypothetical protein
MITFLWLTVTSNPLHFTDQRLALFLFFTLQNDPDHDSLSTVIQANTVTIAVVANCTIAENMFTQQMGKNRGQ